MWTRTNTQLYHNGHWLIDPRGSFVGFKSLITGWVYHVEAIDRDDLDAARAEWAFATSSAPNGRLYAEDVRIWHTFEADCGYGQDGEIRIDDMELDGQPCNFEDDHTKDVMMDDLWETYLRESA